MFRPVGLFKGIPCPKQHECNLQNCIFDHTAVDSQGTAGVGDLYDPFAIIEDTPPPSKKRKLESPEQEPLPQINHDRELKSTVITERPLKVPRFVQNSKADQSVGEAKPQPLQENGQPPKFSPKDSINRPVTPPTKRSFNPLIQGEVEKLIPRRVAKAPAALKVRLSLVELIHKQITALNAQIASEGSDSKNLLLTDQQLIKWVLDEEEEAATKLASEIYRNTVSQKIVQYKRIKIDDWKKLVQAKISESSKEDDQKTAASAELSTEEEGQILRYLRTNLTGLDSHGYVTKPPSTAEIQHAKATIRASGGYEVCDRCGTRFQVFPGRDAQGRVTTKGECHYHWAKLNRGQWQKTDHITGQAQSSYPCCGQSAGSEGCTRATTHVFKVSDPKRLAALLQFEETPARNDGKRHGPIAFDCEMAYTTYGMEVVRVTAVSWPQGEEVLDILVRPFGEVLDLNTRFSGVSQEQFTNAAPHEATTQADQNASDGADELDRLRKVDSPAVARHLMFELLGPDTPLIGHAIDNDLNACRIIHPFVIDTVLLYPHPRGLPIRYGLKVLASKYLDRSIQTGGEAGHDSKEDSIATGDLVRVKVLEKWQKMRLQGWKFHNGALVPPGR